MSQNSRIEWTHHTFNPWWGCEKVSPGCKNCYAERVSQRFGFEVFGSVDRRLFNDKHWLEPFKWDAKAKRAGTPARVFCGSMCDIFDNHPGLDDERKRLWNLIESTPNLIWLILTKRPQNIKWLLPVHWMAEPQANVWLGVSAENQREADVRLPLLLEIPAQRRFVSCEPLLGMICLKDYLHGLDWVIVGGESGPYARPMHPDWAKFISNQCSQANVPFFFKQWGEWSMGPGIPGGYIALNGHYTDDPRELIPANGEYMFIRRPGKKAAGRELDGREWDMVPEA